MNETPQPNQTRQPAGDVLPSISVVLCCHNSAERLPETLRHLSEQRVPDGLTWEILVIDNASTDDTPQLVHEFSEHNSQLTVRLVRESRLGQAYARERGVSEAVYDTLLFVDDDNWLASDYLSIVAETLRKHPEIAALGGTSTGCCEGQEPAWLEKYQGWYALTGLPKNRESLTEEEFLWGAGVAFRRSALDRANSLGLTPLLSGRSGKALDAGEDVELCRLVRLAGGRLFRHSGMHFTHYLPARRLTWEYLGRLFYAAGRVSVKLDAYRLNEETLAWPRWMVQSGWIQICFACFQTMRYGFGLWWADARALEGNDRVLKREIYRGRLAALWEYRRDYESMIARYGGRIAQLPRMQTTSVAAEDPEP